MIQRIVLSVLLLSLISCSHSSKTTTETSGENTQQKSTSTNGADLNLDVKKYTLDNGLRVLLIENHKLPIFSYYTFYDVGGRYESHEKGTTGATHFLEHMMFKGAKKYGPGEFDSIIESSGGSTNAYTTFDNTVYYENMPSDMLEKIIDLEADRMENLLLLPESFESERKVVMEERKYRYENSPRGKLYLKMMKAMFKGTPYGGSVIGSVKDLKSLDRNQMMEFFKTFYTPDNAIVVIAGDIDPEETLETFKEKFGELEKSSGLEEYKTKKDASERYKFQGDYGRSIAIHGSSPTPLFMLSYKGKKLGEREGFVMDILSSILGDGESSYFHQKYVKGKRPYLNNIGVSNYTLKHNGVFFVSGELLKGVNLNRFKKRLLRDTKRVCGKAITERSLQKTKNQYLVDYYNEIQTNAGVAHFVGLREYFYGDYEFYKKEIDIYNSITTDEVKMVCNKVFDDEYIFLSLWNSHPQKKK